MERLILRPKPVRPTASRRPRPALRAFRLKAALLAFVAVLAVALGVGSVTVGDKLFAPGSGSGCRISLHEFQAILQSQAQACVAKPPPPSGPASAER